MQVPVLPSTMWGPDVDFKLSALFGSTFLSPVSYHSNPEVIILPLLCLIFFLLKERLPITRSERQTCCRPVSGRIFSLVSWKVTCRGRGASKRYKRRQKTDWAEIGWELL